MTSGAWEIDLDRLDGVVGVGIDLVDIARIDAALGRTPGLVGRLFTPEERRYCEATGRPRVRAQRYAGRFAAKEAAMKALGLPIHRDVAGGIEVRRGEQGRPALRVQGRAADRAAEVGGRRWLVSLTHTSSLAQAIVVLQA